MKKKSSKVPLPQPSKKELAEKAKYEEFWSDPCWTEPLEVTEFPTKALL